MFENELKIGNIYSVRDKYGCISFDAEFIGLVQNCKLKELLLFESIRGKKDNDFYKYCGVEARSHYVHRQNKLITELWVVRYGHDKHLKNYDPDENYWILLK